MRSTLGRHLGPRGKALVKPGAATLPRFDGSVPSRGTDCTATRKGEAMADPTSRTERLFRHRAVIFGLLLAVTLALGAAAHRTASPPTPPRIAAGNGTNRKSTRLNSSHLG